MSPFDGDFITCTEENPVSAQVPAEMGVDVGVCVALQVASERPAFEHLNEFQVELLSL